MSTIRFSLALFLLIGVPIFALAQTNVKDNILQKKAYRLLDMEVPETVNYQLLDESPDSTLSDMIITEVRNGKLTAYTNAYFTDSLDAAGINICLDRWHDTSLVAGNPDSAELVMRITVSRYTDGRTNTLKIAEDWTFDQKTGAISVNISGIAPQRNKFTGNKDATKYTDMFWVKYGAVRALIARYDAYHPTNNIPLQIWRDYFEREQKPAIK